MASWLLVMIAGSAAVEPGVDFEEPLVMPFPYAVRLCHLNCRLFALECNRDVAPTIVPASIIMGAMESLLIITGTMGAGKTSVLGQSKRNHLK